jgi:hypothetical protein
MVHPGVQMWSPEQACFLPHAASKELGFLPLLFGVKSNSQKKPKRRKF